jgi:hypothetical protein
MLRLVPRAARVCVGPLTVHLRVGWTRCCGSSVRGGRGVEGVCVCCGGCEGCMRCICERERVMGGSEEASGESGMG